MCGIAGIVSRAMPLDEKRAWIAVMAAAMRHRGPDGVVIHVDEDLALAHLRLAIVDPAGPHRLSWDARQRRLLALNGEIYNHTDVRRELGASFAGGNDAETVAHAIDELGVEAHARFDGEYALCWWDRDARRGFLARDPAGSRPLYVATMRDALVFASELRPLLACAPELREIDTDALAAYLVYRFVPSPYTAFRHIAKLAPGHWLPIGGGPARPRPLPRHSGPALPGDDEGRIAITRRTVAEAVRRRVPAEVSWGVLLSGGLDSSTVAAMAGQHSAETIRTYSIAIPGAEESEHERSRAMAAYLRSRHEELAVSAADFREHAAAAALAIEEPLADPPATLLWLLCRAASRDVRVLLGGDGADELFAGYPVYREHHSGRYQGMGRLVSPERRKALFAHRDLERFAPPETRPSLQSMLDVDFGRLLADDLLLKSDKVAMAHGIEIRSPFLCREVTAVARALPPHLRIAPDGTMKYALRMAAKPWLPLAIATQPKRGFPMPLRHWLSGPLRGWSGELLAAFDERRIFETRDLVAGPESTWSVMALELFLQQLADASAGPRIALSMEAFP